MKRLYKLFTLISFLEFLAEYSNVIYNIIKEKSDVEVKKVNLNSVLIINILTKYLFSVVILHSHFYKHHYLSLVINIIFLIILGIMDVMKMDFNSENCFITFLNLTIKALIVIFFSLEDVYAKIILSYDSISPYVLLFYRAIFLNIFVFLFSVIFIFVPLPDENYENSIIFTRFWKIYEDKLNILKAMGIFILQFLYNLNIFFIIDKFSPSHAAMASIMGSLGVLINSTFIFRDIDINEFFIRFALYILLLIAASIHNEFIIIRCCGLETHTRLFLEKLADLDNYNINDNTINDNYSNENNENNKDNYNDFQSDVNPKESMVLFKLEEEKSLDEH